jgi:hypothetical protein
MMTRIVFLFLVCSSMSAAQTASKPDWSSWEPYLGTWSASGTGEPGLAAGEFTFQPELQGAVLARHSYAQYPATKQKPAYRHDDLMMIYPTRSGGTAASYWDNEGHHIQYRVEMMDGKLVLTSTERQPGPRFRLKYEKTGPDALKLTFEIAPPTDRANFKTYIEASAQRKR